MGDPLTEEERRRHIEHDKVFQRLASKHRRGSILHDLGKEIDRHNVLLQRRENSTDQVEGRASRRASQIQLGKAGEDTKGSSPACSVPAYLSLKNAVNDEPSCVVIVTE